MPKAGQIPNSTLDFGSCRLLWLVGSSNSLIWAFKEYLVGRLRCLKALGRLTFGSYVGLGPP